MGSVISDGALRLQRASRGVLWILGCMGLYNTRVDGYHSESTTYKKPSIKVLLHIFNIVFTGMARSR